MSALLEQARDAFARRGWLDAFTAFSGADQQEPLGAEDLERLGLAAQLLARDDSADAWTRAHDAHVDAGHTVRAARAAFWLGMNLMHRGEMARAGGWFARAQQHVETVPGDVPERGLLLIPMALQAMFGGDPAAALSVFERAKAGPPVEAPKRGCPATPRAAPRTGPRRCGAPPAIRPR